jgi:hypothetical protein
MFSVFHDGSINNNFRCRLVFAVTMLEKDQKEGCLNESPKYKIKSRFFRREIKKPTRINGSALNVGDRFLFDQNCFLCISPCTCN